MDKKREQKKKDKRVESSYSWPDNAAEHHERIKQSKDQ